MTKVYRETRRGNNFEKVLLTEKCTQSYWENLTEKAMNRAMKRNGNILFFPESTFAFSIIKEPGVEMRFIRCNNY
jgi:hypothetical protein